MDTYVLKMEARPVRGYGPHKDQTRVVTAPSVSNVITGSALGFRPNELPIAEAAVKALNKGQVQFDSRTDDEFAPLLSAKHAKATLERIGALKH